MRILFLVISLVLFDTIASDSQCLSGNCRNGKGTYKFKSGGKYVGQFKNFRLTGKGTFYFTNGNVYKGIWKNNYRQGKGVLKLATGDIYKGEFKANKFWGKGAYIFATGEKYIGDWYNDKATGDGVYVFTNGEKYKGKFKEGKFNGFGTYNYKNGSKYEGSWKNNKRDGDGKLLDANGQIQYGVWKNDVIVSQKEISYKDKSGKEIVQHDNDNRNCNRIFCKSGKGIYTYKDGSKWVGEFNNGKPYGQGICSYADGRKYEGYWKKNVPQGEGIMYMENGEIYGGVWDKGVLIRKAVNESISEDKKEITYEAKTNPKVNIWALVVGIGNYNHMPVLKYTDDDAYQVYAFLKSPEGGAVEDKQIKLLIDENATKEKIKESLDFIVRNADENDVVFIYYAGHGVDGAFVPFDFDGYNNLYRHKDILDVLNQSRAKHRVLIADACHSGSMIAQRSPFRSMLAEYYSDFEKTKGGTALIMSSKEDENSLEYSGMRQGVFSYYLIKGLQGEADYNKNGFVTVQEIFDFVYVNVRKHTHNIQTPLISGDYDKEMPISVVRRDF